jgi:hypothetical protein
VDRQRQLFVLDPNSRNALEVRPERFQSLTDLGEVLIHALGNAAFAVESEFEPVVSGEIDARNRDPGRQVGQSAAADDHNPDVLLGREAFQ